MGRPQPIITRAGRKSGEFIVEIPAAWELRLRRVLRELLPDDLPDPREPGLSARQREHRIQMRRKRMQEAVCRFISELITADVIGKEVALATRTRFGSRRGSLREHVEAILKEVAKA